MGLLHAAFHAASAANTVAHAANHASRNYELQQAQSCANSGDYDGAKKHLDNFEEIRNRDPYYNIVKNSYNK